MRKDPHMSSKNSISGNVVYYPNNNNLTKTLVLPYSNTHSLKKFVKANYLSYLVKPLIIYPTSMLL